MHAERQYRGSLQQVGRRRAWRVRVVGWPESESVCFADSRAKAHRSGWAGCEDANWNVKWTEFRVTRAAEFDRLAGVVVPNRCYALDYVKTLQPPTGKLCNSPEAARSLGEEGSESR